LHLRKRLEPYPARSWFLRMLDRMVIVVGVLGPAFALPQLYTIWTEHNAAGIAPLSWSMWALFNIPWILYGIAHKELPIITTYSFWLVINILIATGGIIYA
jgi:uncharacterized protein with PQ loop repeat